MSAHLASARRSLALALSDVERCLPRPGKDWRQVVDDGYRSPDANGRTSVRWVRVNDTGVPACTNCKPITYSAARVDSGGLCNWCYEWKLEHGDPPWLELVQAHASGRRITNVVYQEAVKAEARREAERKAAEEKAKKRGLHRRKVKR